ncbi:Salicylate O-methyltransferase [Acorus gramineus]|uniref:Salicylate O-methyltransferase n=1 Tax=Acorus gramineus TaxID=55184 RepID=A0AAV9B8I4_ACOGR|nr:Salicylate O-methyltransferase [Acorus gramineus]
MQIMLFLNDLPSNDFNTLFQHLPTFYEGLKGVNEEEQQMLPTYVAVVPGSFFERLFPDNSIHFIHASYSVHWLAQKGNIFMSKSSPQGVFKSYLEEFQKDFMLFLKARSKEMVPGGCMVLTLLGRRSFDPSSDECCQPFKLLSDALFEMVSQVIRVSKILRAAFEPMLLIHFGEDLPLDDLFSRFANNVSNYMGKKKFISLLVTLKKKY